MLSKPNRLSANDIALIRKTGSRSKTGWLVTVSVKNNSTTPRFAVMVPAKTCRMAHHRNRSKRLVSEALRLMIKDGQVPPGLQAVLIVQRDISTMTASTVRPVVFNSISKHN